MARYTKRGKPFPYWVILLAPSLQLVPGSVYRAALPILFAFWASDCEPFPPDNDTTFASVTRMSNAQWTTVKADTLAAIEPICKQLRAEWEDQRRNLPAKQRLAAYARAAQAKKRAERNLIATAERISETYHTAPTRNVDTAQPRQLPDAPPIPPAHVIAAQTTHQTVTTPAAAASPAASQNSQTNTRTSTRPSERKGQNVTTPVGTGFRD